MNTIHLNAIRSLELINHSTRPLSHQSHEKRILQAVTSLSPSLAPPVPFRIFSTIKSVSSFGAFGPLYLYYLHQPLVCELILLKQTAGVELMQKLCTLIYFLTSSWTRAVGLSNGIPSLTQYDSPLLARFTLTSPSSLPAASPIMMISLTSSSLWRQWSQKTYSASLPHPPSTETPFRKVIRLAALF